MRIKLISFCWAGALVIALSATSYGQASRTWVSSVGNDADPCSRSAPCKTFAGAYSKTTAFGEINVVDPGAYGTLTIGKSITVRSDHIEAGVLVSGINGFIVNVAATDDVVIDGLDFEGLGAGAASLNGVKVIGTGKVFIRNCRIHGFRSVNGTDGNGVLVAGTANARVIIENCQINNNTGGVSVKGTGGAANSATITHSTIDANTNFAVKTGGAANSLGLLSTILTGSIAGIDTSAGGSVVSFGANNLVSGSGAPTATVPLK
jgi:hypothetical protein